MFQPWTVPPQNAPPGRIPDPAVSAREEGSPPGSALMTSGELSRASAALRTWGGLLIYCGCGTVCGVLVAALSVPAWYAFYEWDCSKRPAAIRPMMPPFDCEPWRTFLPGWYQGHGRDVDDVAIDCAKGRAIHGIFCGGFLWMIACLWPSSRHPFRLATLCASLGGICVLLCLTNYHLGRPPDRDQFTRDLAGGAAIMIFGAVFGLTHALLTRRVLLWWQRNGGNAPG